VSEDSKRQEGREEKRNRTGDKRIKCVLCGAEAEYVKDGMSLCEKHFRAQEVENKEIDLVKIQIYADRCHTFLTLGCSLGFVVLGLWGVYAAVYYQGWSNFKISDVYVGWIGMMAMLMLAVITLGVFRIRYDRWQSKISKMIDAVQKGKHLPDLDKLDKWDC
jgi:ribosomal protein S14